MEIIKQEYGETEYTVEITQSELNTIAATLGRTTDHTVRDYAKDYSLDKYFTSSKLTDLYKEFKNKVK